MPLPDAFATPVNAGGMSGGRQPFDRHKEGAAPRPILRGQQCVQLGLTSRKLQNQADGSRLIGDSDGARCISDTDGRLFRAKGDFRLLRLQP